MNGSPLSGMFFAAVTFPASSPTHPVRVTKDAWRAGIFAAPHGIAWDAHGNLIVSEWSLTGRLTKLALVR